MIFCKVQGGLGALNICAGDRQAAQEELELPEDMALDGNRDEDMEHPDDAEGPSEDVPDAAQEEQAAADDEQQGREEPSVPDQSSPEAGVSRILL
jgi:hypothetical protein